MHDILVLSPSFNKDNSNQYILSIQLSLDGFSFSVCDSISNKFVLLKHKPFSQSGTVQQQTQTLLKQEEHLKLNYKTVLIAYELSPSTLVPKVLFEVSKKELFYGRNYRLHPNSVLKSDTADSFNNVTVYAIDEAILSMLSQHFPSAKIHHYNHIKHTFAATQGLQADATIFLTIRQKKFSVSVFKDQTMLLENTYAYQNDDEFLYFFLYCFKQLDLDQMKTAVIIDGIIPKHASLVKQLQRFVSHVSFAAWPESFNFANDFYDLPPHYFIYMYANLLCA